MLIHKLNSSVALGFNKIPSIPDDIQQLVNLEELFCADNKIVEVSGAISKLTNLKKFTLASNLLKNLPIPEILSLKNLQVLTIHNNPFGVENMIMSPLKDDNIREALSSSRPAP